MILEIPIRNWNGAEFRIQNILNKILEIPIRNWNGGEIDEFNKNSCYIRNTYKELKHRYTRL